MMPNQEYYIVFDLDTPAIQKSVPIPKMPFSIGCWFDSRSHAVHTFTESAIDSFADALRSANLIVGHNIRNFDLPILEKYLDFEVDGDRVFDIMEQLKWEMGFPISLDNLASNTLNRRKASRKGEAPLLWERGELETLIYHAQMDILLTKMIFEYGLWHKCLYYHDKYEHQTECIHTGYWESEVMDIWESKIKN